MASSTYRLGPDAEVVIRRCEADLQLSGHGDDSVVVISEAMPALQQEGNRLVIEECEDDLDLRVGQGASVMIEEVQGDAWVRNLRAFTIRRVEGDLKVRHVSELCRAEEVQGDLSVWDSANVSISRVEGDADLEQVRGIVGLRKVEGDARLSGSFALDGECRVEGDLLLEAALPEGSSARLVVEGDAELRIPEGVGLSLRAMVEGDVTGLGGASGEGTYLGAWGDGGAQLELEVSGDLSVSGGALVPGLAVAEPEAHAPAVGTQRSGSDLDVLESLARGEITTEEAERMLSGPQA